LRFVNNACGATAIEYALICALIFLGAVAGFIALGDQSTGIWGGLESDVVPALESNS
jgi:pilus assembly protein Flp/PilA